MIYDVFVNNFQIFLMVLARIIGLFVTAPFFQGTNFPWRFKIGFGLFISLIATPMVVAAGMEVPADIADYGVKVLGNAVIGMGLGFFIYLVITAFQVSAQVFSIPMGLGMNEVVDPMSQIQVPALGNLLGIMILLLLVQVDGHFYIIKLLVESFEGIAGLSYEFTQSLAQGLLSGVLLLFEIAVKISLPVVGVTLLLDFAMGLISRVAPQFNVMIMGFNIKILAGFFIMWMTLPALVNLGGIVIENIMDSTEYLIAYLGTVG